MSASRALLAMAALFFVTACGDSRRAAEISSAIKSRVAIDAVLTGDETIDREAYRFYSERHFNPAWVVGRHVARATQALDLLGSAPHHGIAIDADRGVLARDIAAFAADRKADPARVADIDVRVTVAVLHFGRAAAVGVGDPTQVDARWKARRVLPELGNTLAAADDLREWVARVQPQHHQYEQLRQELVRTLTAADLSDNERGQRATVLALNMDRWRWMPDDLGPRHLLVNIPAFELQARENGASVLTMRVVTGKKNGNETPIFSGDMKTAVFSPAWNVPDSIAGEETVPAVKKDPAFLDRQQMDIFRRTRNGLVPVSADEIDWSDAEAGKGLAFRQRPGPGNALGHVKFLFPNAYDVYLHDTPNRSVFARDQRALSHGCVRVSKPAELAAYLLRDQAAWDAAAIKTAMHSGEERHVRLTESVPVHIAYFTAWSDEAGTVAFFDDVYGYDRRQAELRSDDSSE